MSTITNQNEWNSNKERLTSIGEPPLTPTNDGEVHFLGPETVQYISPPRFKTVQRNAPPPYPHNQVHPMSYPPPMQQQFQPQYYPPQQPQYMQQMYAPQPIMYAPSQMIPQPQPAIMMMQPPAQIIQQIPAVQPPPPPPQQQSQQSPQNINVVVNSSPTTTLVGAGKGGGNSTLLCPKCRVGIITRQEDKKRKKILLCLTIFCLPCTFGLLLCCLRCNYVDMCGACGKGYGHRGKKKQNTKVNAVTV